MNNPLIIEPDDGYDVLEKVTAIVNIAQQNIQMLKQVNINSNTTTNILPDEGYDGIKKVVVTTNIPPTEVENGSYVLNYNEFTAPSNDNSVGPLSNKEIVPTSGFNFDKFKVYLKRENKTITSNGTYTPSSTDNVLSKVIVNVQPTLQQKNNIRVTNNTTVLDVQPDSGYDGLSIVRIYNDVEVPTITQITNYPISSNGIINVPIPTGYDAVDYINLLVSVPASLKFENNQVVTLTKREENIELKDQDGDLLLEPQIQVTNQNMLLKSNTRDVGSDTFIVKLPDNLSLPDINVPGYYKINSNLNGFVSGSSSAYDFNFTVSSYAGGYRFSSNDFTMPTYNDTVKSIEKSIYPSSNSYYSRFTPRYYIENKTFTSNGTYYPTSTANLFYKLTINVPTSSKINISYVSYMDTSFSPVNILISNFYTASSNTTVTIPSSDAVVVIREEETNYYTIYVKPGSSTFSVLTNDRYTALNNCLPVLELFTANDEKVSSYNFIDSTQLIFKLSKTFYNI